MKNKLDKVENFKNWMFEQNNTSDFTIGSMPADPNKRYIGKPVFAIVSNKKLLEKIATEGDADQLINEFSKSGGTVLNVEANQVKIQTSVGELSLPRFCVKLSLT